MKKLLLLAALFTTGIAATAQQKADEAIKINAETYSFGKIKQGVPVTTYFTITNTTDKPIAIESATAGCGCTTPEYSKEPIAPNGTTKLKVGYNAANAGAFNKPVYVKITGYQEPKTIYITGEVISGDAAAAPATPAAPAVAPAVATKTEAKPAKKVKVKVKSSK